MVLAVLGLIAISAITRSLFFLTDQPWHLPPLVERGLRYAPLAALSAVVAPDIMLTQGQWMPTWQDARWYATAAAMAYAAWRRDMLGTIVVGMAVLLPLKLGLGW
ncbi:MAG TPA: AzlD domain-containing protein [Aquabacterium sp.]|nr:AzlD domain-containing protein [Aquabacterium sp.]